MSRREFDRCVDDAIDSIPDDLFDMIDNCVILVADEAPADDPSLLGLYEGIPATERDSGYGAVLPDRILIFRRNLLDLCQDRDELIDEIHITVVHEIAHYFGIDDERLHALGYA